MKQILTSLLVNSAFAATMLFGQTPTPTPMPAPMHSPPSPAMIAQRQVQRLTTLLDLTSTQQSDALPVFTTASAAALSVASSMQTARKALHTAILANDTGTDPNSIGVLSTTIGNLTAQLVQAEGVAQAAFYQLLTPTQQTKYSMFGQRGIMGGPGFGPGGGPGPGPGGMGGPGPGGFRGGR